MSQVRLVTYIPLGTIEYSSVYSHPFQRAAKRLHIFYPQNVFKVVSIYAKLVDNNLIVQKLGLPSTSIEMHKQRGVSE